MNLELFYFEACPFCQIVLKEIDRLNVKVDYKNIFEDQASADRLIRDTGRKTTPCLYIDNRPMFESNDIVEWLEKNAETLEKRN